MNLIERVNILLRHPDKSQERTEQGQRSGGKKMCLSERASDIHEHATEQITITTRKAKEIAAQAQNLLKKGIE